MAWTAFDCGSPLAAYLANNYLEVYICTSVLEHETVVGINAWVISPSCHCGTDGAIIELHKVYY